MNGAPPPAGSVVCAVDDVADGSSRVVTFAGGFELIVVRTGDAVFGYVNECKHLQVGLNLLDDHACETNAGTILCQYHYATYRFEDGYCIAGPCQGDSLTAVPLAVRSGRIVIATGSAAK
jgi:nitrite reductase/ring-hydroxylating ferredoxin subunit